MKKILLLILCLTTFLLDSTEEKKVALLFLTRSDLNQTQLWKEWIDPNKYNVYNHPKDLVKNTWFAQFRIDENQPTEWGFLLNAQQALLRAALKDPSNYKFVFVSESCIPIRTKDQVYDLLIADDYSYMQWRSIWWSTSHTRNLSEFPPEYHLGNHQWIILNRKHAKLIVDDDYWLNLSMQHTCCDESYPATFFNMMGVLDEFKNVMTTYVDWERGGPYYFKDPSLENFIRLKTARYNKKGETGENCSLFARKIAPEFPVETLRFIINEGKR